MPPITPLSGVEDVRFVAVSYDGLEGHHRLTVAKALTDYGRRMKEFRRRVHENP
jgi:hypothetical protein